MKAKFLAFGLILAAGILPTSALAFTTAAYNEVSLAPDSTVNGTYYAAGNNLNIRGTVNGDVICGGQTVVISGPVSGDVICAAQTITITGPVAGNVRVAGQTVALNGKVGRNASVFAQTFSQSAAGAITGELMAQVQTIRLDGSVVGQAYGNAAQVTLNGNNSGAVRYGAESVEVGPTAKLDGGLYYTSNSTAKVASGAVITGANKRTAPAPQQHKTAAAAAAGRLTSWAVSLLGALVVGLAIVWLSPRIALAAGRTLAHRPGLLALGGLVALVITPIAAVIAMVTIIGLPFGLIVLVLWGIALYFSRVLAAVALGVLLERRYRKTESPARLYLAAAAGILLSWAVFLIPVLGGIASLVMTLIGFGILGKALRDFIDREDDAAKGLKVSPAA